MKTLNTLKTETHLTQYAKNTIARLENEILCAIKHGEDVATVGSIWFTKSKNKDVADSVEEQVKKAGYDYDLLDDGFSSRYVIYLNGEKSVMPKHVARSIGDFLSVMKPKRYNYSNGDVVYYKIIFDNEETPHKVIDIEEISPELIIKSDDKSVVYSDSKENINVHKTLSDGQFAKSVKCKMCETQK